MGKRRNGEMDKIRDSEIDQRKSGEIDKWSKEELKKRRNRQMGKRRNSKMNILTAKLRWGERNSSESRAPKLFITFEPFQISTQLPIFLLSPIPVFILDLVISASTYLPFHFLISSILVLNS